MIQDIRDHLKISREDLAAYLELSPHMVQSVEQGRRQLPLGSMKAVIELYQLVLDVKVSGPVNDPNPVADRQVRHVKRLHRRYRRKLSQSTDKLEQMRKSHAGACFNLAVYQRLADAMRTANNKNDHIRQQWTQRQIKDTLQRMEANNPAAQEFLAAQIDSLKTLLRVLEGSPWFRLETEKQ